MNIPDRLTRMTDDDTVGTNGFPLPPPIQMQPLHAAAGASSHPLAKTMSLPSSSPTVTPGVSPTPLHTMTLGRPLPPPPPPPIPPPAGLSAPNMQARKSLPGMNHGGGGLPAKSPARPSPLHPHPLSSPGHATAMHAAGAQKSPRPQPHMHQQQQQRHVLNSDRPESDSEASEDEATPAVVGSASVPQKMPRQGLGGASDMRRSATGNGNGNGGSGSGSGGVGGAGAGSAAQKVPRKGMAGTPQGRKSVARGES